MAFSLDKVRDGINEFKTTIIYFSVVMSGIDENPSCGQLLLFAFKNSFLQKRHYEFIDFGVLFQ